MPTFYPVKVDCTGQLYMMPKPASDRLEQEIRACQAQGVEFLVSLLEPAEAAEHGLAGEATECATCHIDFRTLPIPDFGVPEAGPFTPLVTEIEQRVRRGETVAIHCRAGIGRSGVLVCCVLGRLGMTADDAIRHASIARGETVPETDAQRAFVRKFIEGLGSDPA